MYSTYSIIQVFSICPVLIVKAIFIVNTDITHVGDWALTRATGPISNTYPIPLKSGKNTDFMLFLICASQQLESLESDLLKAETVCFEVISPVAKDTTSLPKVSNKDFIRQLYKSVLTP